MESVFVVQHLHLLPNSEDSVCFIGVYRTLDAAKAAIQRLGVQPGFCKYPQIIDPTQTDEEQGFYIDKCELDKDHWTEGFVPMEEDQEFQE
jgi:hypothetical protein